MDEKKYEVVDRGLFAMIVVQNAPFELVEKYQGFCAKVTSQEQITWFRFYNSTDSDQEIVKQFISDLAEVGFSQ